MAAVYFAPYVLKVDDAQGPGLLADLVDALNQSQSDFNFVMVPTSLKRRFLDLEQKRTDISLFENPAWGWERVRYQGIDMGLVDEEVYVARSEAGRGQAYFDDLTGKRLALYASYHYQFADFNIEPQFLSREFNAVLGYSHESNLLMVLHRRADVTLMTRSFIERYLKLNPQYADQVLISDRVDQVYRHQAILREGAPITAAQFTSIYEALRDSGKLQEIFGSYRVKVLPRTPANISND